MKVPYEAESIAELVRKQKTVRIKNIPYFYGSALNEIIHEMLQFNPKKRISGEKVKQHCLKQLKMDQ